MNRQQRKAAGKGQSDQRVDVTGIIVHFGNGQYARMDTGKVMLVDKDTMRPLFHEVLEQVNTMLAEPTTPHQEFANEQDAQAYTVEFDTPEGRMIYVKKGNWSGVKPA